MEKLAAMGSSKIPPVVELPASARLAKPVSVFVPGNFFFGAFLLLFGRAEVRMLASKRQILYGLILTSSLLKQKPFSRIISKTRNRFESACGKGA